MTKKQKVDLLYKRALGEVKSFSPNATKELSKYKVYEYNDRYRSIVKKANLEEYVTAVDNGECKISYLDWCRNNGKADRRYRNSSKENIMAENKVQMVGMFLIGAIFWGILLSYLSIASWASIVIGGIISVMMYRINRDNLWFTCIVLPLLIAVFKEVFFTI